MADRTETAAEFWSAVAQDVTTKVEPVLRHHRGAREPVRAYLRELEAVALAEGGGRDVLQVIASGRRLLGDAEGPADRGSNPLK